jgi:membrane dipeptidase
MGTWDKGSILPKKRWKHMNNHEKAVQLHRQSFVSDAHCDTILDVLKGKRRLAERSSEGQIDLPKLHEGNVSAQVFAVWTPPERYADALKYGMEAADAFLEEVEDNDDLISATTVDDLDFAFSTGKVAGILGMEGAEPLKGSISVLRDFYRLGLRLLTLTWNFRNEAADGVKESITRGGLTRFGRDLVAACNDLGIILDVSHLSPAGVEDVLALSSKPIIASHSNAKALCNHPRNLTDEQIKAIASTGGAIGVTFVPAFLRKDKENASVSDVLDHIDYITKLVGAEHVMLGSDFDGMGETVPKGLEDASKLPALTEGLVERGYNEDEIKTILGLNFRRVFAEVTGGSAST